MHQLAAVKCVQCIQPTLNSDIDSESLVSNSISFASRRQAVGRSLQGGREHSLPLDTAQEPRRKPAGMMQPSPSNGSWWRDLTPYMWWVLLVAGLGWLFDVMDQRIFSLSRVSALDELLSVRVDDALYERIEKGRATAGEVATALNILPGEPLDQMVTIEPVGAARPRPVLVLPPRLPGGQPRKLAFVRKGTPIETWVAPEPERNLLIGRVATAIFLAGWATGGLLFGILGDKWGRAYTMMLTILVYAVFTGLSAFSVSWIDYSIYRFLTGMGVGGEFAAGAALVAEVMTPRARPYALGLLQALSALGNILGSILGLLLTPVNPSGEWERWRALYLVGIVPALLIVVIRGRLKEPERWQSVKESTGVLLGKKLGAFGDLFSPRLRRNTWVGVLLGTAGVIGLWGVGFWTPDLVKEMTPDPGVRAVMFALQDVGAFLGILAITLITEGARRSRMLPALVGLVACGTLAGLFVWLGGGAAGAPVLTALIGVSCCGALYSLSALLGAWTGGIGRRASFILSFTLALLATLAVFRYMTEVGQIYWMIPILGFCGLLCFGMYVIYFPELYPTRLRTTGSSFCYNVARYLAAGGLFLMGYVGKVLNLRESGQIFAFIYVVGIVAAFWALETRGKPLPED